MAEVLIEFDVYGVPSIKLKLSKMERAARNVRPAWVRAAAVVAERNRRVFQSQGLASGRRWRALSPRYAAWKAVNYPGKTILRRTDRLYRSLTMVPLDVQRLTTSTATFGTKVPYARYHQYGTRWMPARPPVTESRRLRREVYRLVKDHLVS